MNCWFDISAVKNGDGLILSFLDITKRKLIEEDLRNSKDLLQSVFEISQTSITVHQPILDQKGSINDFVLVMANKYSSKIIGDKATVGMNFTGIYSEKLRDDFFQRLVEVMYTGKQLDTELWYEVGLKKAWLRVVACVMGELLFVSMEDVTERKLAEEQLIQFRLSKQREILDAVLHAQNLDRERIGEALHNGVGQLLYSLKISCERLIKNEQFDRELIKEISSRLIEAINETKNISFELVPTVLRDFGVEHAIKALIKRVALPELPIHFHFSGVKKRLPEIHEIAIYRIVKELTNNLIKHSRASIAHIRVTKNGEYINVVVEDNGMGFDDLNNNNKLKGIGLQSVKNRAKLLNAFFQN